MYHVKLGLSLIGKMFLLAGVFFLPAVNAYRSDAFKSSFKQAPKKAFILFYETEEMLPFKH